MTLHLTAVEDRNPRPAPDTAAESMSSRVNVGPDYESYDDRMPNDPADVGPRAAHLQTSAGGTHTHALSATGTRLFDCSVLNSLGWGLRTLDNAMTLSPTC